MAPGAAASMAQLLGLLLRAAVAAALLAAALLPGLLLPAEPLRQEGHGGGLEAPGPAEAEADRPWSGNGMEPFSTAQRRLGLASQSGATRSKQRAKAKRGRCGAALRYLDKPDTVDLPAIDCGDRLYRDDPKLAALYVRPEAPGGLQTFSVPGAGPVERLVLLGYGAGFEFVEAMKEPNDFVVYGPHVDHPEANNRLARMANAEYLLLLSSGIAVDNGWVQSAVQLLDNLPATAMIGGGRGLHKGQPVRPLQAPVLQGLPFAFADYLYPGGPVLVRRAAFLEVRGLATEQRCFGPHGVCDSGLEADLSLRLWAAGWQVGMMPTGEHGEDGGLGLCGAAATPEAVHALTGSLDPEMRRSTANAAAAATEALKRGGTYSAGLLFQVFFKRVRVDKPSCSKVPYTTTRAIPDALKAEVQKCPPGPPQAQASVAIQYYRQKENVGPIMGRLTLFKEPLEVLVNNDSHTEHAQWIEQFRAHGQIQGWLVYSPDVHEIRGYNRLGKLATAETLAFLQDDDLPLDAEWLVHAKRLFSAHKSMGLLGGHRGRMATGEMWSNLMNQIEGEKYGPGYEMLPYNDPGTHMPFMFVYKVNAAPLLVRRSTFLQLGMFDRRFSCPGGPGIGFDFEYSVRNWYNGHSVGLYTSNFQSRVLGETGGTRTSFDDGDKRKRNKRRNNLSIYKLFPGFHHKVGTAAAAKENTKLVQRAHLGRVRFRPS